MEEEKKKRTELRNKQRELKRAFLHFVQLTRALATSFTVVEARASYLLPQVCRNLPSDCILHSTYLSQHRHHNRQVRPANMK